MVYGSEADPEPRRVLAVRDDDSGLEAWIAVDEVVDGLTVGGIRRVPVDDRSSAIERAKRLGQAWTRAANVADVDAGGGQILLRDHDELVPEQAYRALGRQLEAMEDVFLGLGAGPDLDEADAGERINPEGTVPARAQAVGVLSGIQAVLWALEGDPRAEGTKIVLEGYGPVGRYVAQGLSEEGAMVHVAAEEPAAAEAEEAGHATIASDAWTSEACQVLVPTGTDAIGQAEADGLAARGVCPATLGTLASRKAAEVLHERGVQHAPEALVAGGALVEAALFWREGRAQRVEDEIDRRLADVYDTARRVLAGAADREVPADDIVRDRWG